MCAAPKDKDETSSVCSLLRKDNGDPAKALARYIAGFAPSATSSNTKGGSTGLNQPPCRSYLHLLCFSEFAEIPEKINGCNSKEQLARVASYYRPFKAALTDLLSVTKAATARLTSAIAKATRDATSKTDRATNTVAAKKAGANAQHIN